MLKSKQMPEEKETAHNLIEKIKAYNPEADFSLIEKAFAFAKEKHKGHFRLSKDPYITHPLIVAETLADLEQDVPAIAAALLHDTIEDGGASRDELIRNFGEEITKLVEGVTKLGQLTFETKKEREERQAENFRKMFLAMGEDIRVIVIKLADRLHNMKTIEFLPAAKQKETSLETREIFAPLAHRLGMWRLKWELEDLAFRVLEPQKFEEIKAKVAEKREERENYINAFIEETKKILEKVELKFEISGRPKHFYSIYRKMVDQNLEFDEIYDLIAVRIIVGTIKDCYAVLGVIHSAWKPIPGRFRDYIAMPQPNGYQSLHTTVIGPAGRPVEIQIRTREMHRIAEYGIAAHWRYKEGVVDKTFDQKLAWLRQMLEWQTDLKDARAFLDSLKMELFVDEVFVFTPKGDVVGLPIDATPIDLAYRVHTEVGHRCLGAKVNGRIVSLNYKLKNGDIVEILTGKVDNPSLDWLNFVKTSAAKTKIKSWFKKQKREENVIRGRQALEDEIRKFMLEPAEVLTAENMATILKLFNIASEEELLALIGYGELSAYAVARRLREYLEKEKKIPLIEEEIVKPLLVPKPRRRLKQGIKVAGLKEVLVRFSKCCNPVPGEEIVGFITKGKGVAIHKKDCSNITALDHPPSRMVKVDWDPTADVIYPVEIEVEAFDRVGILRDVVSQISETKTNISAANVKTKRGTSAIIRLIVDIKNIDHLSQVMKAIRSVSDVYGVYRVTERAPRKKLGKA